MRLSQRIRPNRQMRLRRLMRLGMHLSVLVGLWVWVSTINANDWPQFRGPGTRGVGEGNPPTEWSETKNVRWKTELSGRGVSSPVVFGDKVYVTCATGPKSERLHTVCCDLASGKILWERQLFATGNTSCHPQTNMAAPTPVADQDGVVVLFATGDLVAYDQAGNLRWYRSLNEDYGPISNQVGMASSPVQAEGLVIVPMDNVGESFLTGIDPKDGSTRWKVGRPREVNWTTPALYQAGGETLVLMQNAGELAAYSAKTGERKWSFSAKNLATISSPIVVGDRVVVPAGELTLMRLEGNVPKIEWSSNKARAQAPSALVYRDRVYTVTGGGITVCVDLKTGKQVWQERAKGPVWASPIAAGGHVYVFSYDTGTATVFAADDKGTRVASNTLNAEIQATPAIVGDTLLIRTDRHLYRIGTTK